MKFLNRKYFVFGILGFLSLCFFVGAFIWREVYVIGDSAINEEKIFKIEKGQGVFQIAENLEEEGLIKNKFFFSFYVFLKGWRLKLQAGKYQLNSSMSIAEIAKKFVLGEVVKEKITIIEGWNLRDIGYYLENRGFFPAEEFFKISDKDFSREFDFLKDKPVDLGLEGYLFPDTYEISLNTNAEEVIKKMLTNFGKKLTPNLREEILKQNKSIFQVITMASLLEKEVNTYKEKELVSGILWKRLAVKIPLQVDATINYLTGRKTIEILKKELEIDSPYNTYKYLGLPKGPISNPGLESIKAALYPKQSDYWYYLSTPEGETKFSKNLKEHTINRNRYLKKR